MNKNVQNTQEPEKKNSGIFFWIFIGLNCVMAILVVIKFLFSK